MLRELLSSRDGLWRGLSEDGKARVLGTIVEAGQVSRQVLEGCGDDPFTEPALRTRCRWVLGLMPEGADLEQVAGFVFANPQMVGEWHRLVEPHKLEYSVEQFRLAVAALMDGAPAPVVQERSGLSVSAVRRLSAFFGTTVAHVDVLWKDALVAAEEELSFELLAAREGLSKREARERVTVWFPEPLSGAAQALADGRSPVWVLVDKSGLSLKRCAELFTQARKVVREVAA